MKKKVIKHGNHSIANDNDGYMYSYNTSESYSFDTHIHKCYEIVHVIKGELYILLRITAICCQAVILY